MASIRQIVIKFCCILLLFQFMVSCSPKNEVTEDELFRFVDLECKAMQLKNQRFELFEEIRRIEIDTIIYAQKKDSLDRVVLELKDSSLLLADNIRKFIDSLFYTKLTDESTRSSFYNKVKLILAERECANKRDSI